VAAVWEAATTTNHDRKRLLRCLIEEVQVWTEEERHRARIIWQGGATTELAVKRVRRGQAHVAPEEKVELVRELAREFNDAQIARILARRGIHNMHGRAHTRAGIVALRKKHNIPACPQQRARDPREGPFTAEEAAEQLGVSGCTIHSWLREGVLRGGQVAPGAPWRIVLNEETRRRLTAGVAPQGWVGLNEAARRLGMPKSTVAHWVNTGKLKAVRTMRGRRSCWKIDLSSADEARQTDLVDQMSKG
jgi:excisionase family DNA binding protein